MQRRKIFWRMYPPFLLLVIGAFIGLGWFVSGTVRRFALKQQRAGLERTMRLASAEFQTATSPPDAQRTQRRLQALGRRSDIRYTIIRRDGVVLADSHSQPAAMDRHDDRPEIVRAFSGRRGYAVRISPTLGQRLLYVAMPLQREKDRVIRVLRLSVAVQELEQLLRKLYAPLLLAGVAIAVLLALSVWLLLSHFIKPLVEIHRGAQRLAQGELGNRLAIPDSRELATLAETLNAMAAQLEKRLRTISRQHDELAAILSSMGEGVMLIDTDDRILRCNQTVAAWLERERAAVVGRLLHEVLRHPELIELVARTRTRGLAEKGELQLRDPRELHLSVSATCLPENAGERPIVLVVLSDISGLKRTEQIRRDFVANVSHELKTPVTAIKGFVETLLDGAIDDPAASQRFLGIIAEQTECMATIIDDLLTLSRVELQQSARGFELVESALEPLLQSALDLAASKAACKGIALSLTCPDDLSLPLAPQLFVQALFNLVDNAVKYSDQGSTVRVEARREGYRVRIDVADHGVGIAAAQLSRIFERFYRVDKARSRKEGGTGLGLAIVKHIVVAHGGTVDVVSQPGSGSTFTIELPIAPHS